MMHMSESAIIDKFRKADNKKDMLQILADLNACSKDDMKAYLLEHGVSEDEFPVRRKKRQPTAVKKENAGEETSCIEPVETIAEITETPELTAEEQKALDRAMAIPMPVRHALESRVEVLTAEIMELEKERNCLRDYLKGMVHGGSD